MSLITVITGGLYGLFRTKMFARPITYYICMYIFQSVIRNEIILTQYQNVFSVLDCQPSDPGSKPPRGRGITNFLYGIKTLSGFQPLYPGTPHGKK